MQLDEQHVDAAYADALSVPYLDTEDPDHLVFSFGRFRITVHGGISLHRLDLLRVTLSIEMLATERLPFRDRCDLYSRSELLTLTRNAADALSVDDDAMEELLGMLASALERYRLSLRAPTDSTGLTPSPPLHAAEHREAHDYLSAPDLMARTQGDLGRTGVVGEVTNRLLLYLVLTSRLRSDPLHALCVGASGSGKTHLQETIGRLVPEEERIEVAALSANALYYFGAHALRHKALLIEDLDGLGGALYPLRELQSKGRLVKSVPFKDAQGRIRTALVTVNGPVATSACTTEESIYTDNANRALLLHLDTSAEQEDAILAYQQRTAAGLVDHVQQEQVRRLFRNIQRALRPVRVHNPWAPGLQLPACVKHRLRANAMYLRLIETITFYHQHTRPLCADEGGRSYIETTLDDIRWANRLIAPVLVVKSDELTPACRAFLGQVQAWVATLRHPSFTSRALRHALDLSPARLKRYLAELRDHGHIEIVGGERYRGGYVYALTPYGRGAAPGFSVHAALDATLEQVSTSGQETAPLPVATANTL